MTESQFNMLTAEEQDILIGEYLCFKGKYGVDFTDPVQNESFFKWLQLNIVNS